VRSCRLPLGAARNRNITTLEGLGSVAHPHRLQKAFIDEQAAQCGFCMNGMIMAAKVLLDKQSQSNEYRNQKELKWQSMPLRQSSAGHPRG
jgi:nicotinate dehydrogenase subunit A